MTTFNISVAVGLLAVLALGVILGLCDLIGRWDEAERDQL